MPTTHPHKLIAWSPVDDQTTMNTFAASLGGPDWFDTFGRVFTSGSGTEPAEGTIATMPVTNDQRAALEASASLIPPGVHFWWIYNDPDDERFATLEETSNGGVAGEVLSAKQALALIGQQIIREM